MADALLDQPGRDAHADSGDGQPPVRQAAHGRGIPGLGGLAHQGVGGHPDGGERDIGGPWQFREVGIGDWLPATVPGTVHTDLLANRKIPDPFTRTNERDLQWIDKKDWEYEAAFDIDAETLAHDHV